jgi:hypothetical protein
MFEEATMREGMMMTREETVAECKRLTIAIRKTDSEKLKRDYGKRLKKLQNRLVYRAD